jgi:hypothetical protein
MQQRILPSEEYLKADMHRLQMLLKTNTKAGTNSAMKILIKGLPATRKITQKEDLSLYFTFVLLFIFLSFESLFTGLANQFFLLGSDKSSNYV